MLLVQSEWKDIKAHEGCLSAWKLNLFFEVSTPLGVHCGKVFPALLPSKATTYTVGMFIVSSQTEKPNKR